MYTEIGIHLTLESMTNRISQLVVFLFFAFALSACVTVDDRIWKESVDKEATSNILGNFSNHASHSSSKQSFAIYNLAQLLGVPVHDADYVRISFEPSGSLKMVWYTGEEEKATRLYLRENGLVVTSDGSIDLPSKGTLTSGKDAGYHVHNVRIFINSNGDLATIQSGAAGQVFIIPIVIYVKHQVIFPRKK